VVPLVYANLGHARDYGVEVFANWSVSRSWKLSPGYSLLQMSVEADPSSHDTTIGNVPGNSPKHQVQIRSMLNLRKNLEWDGSLKYVAGLTGQNVPGYVRVDTRLGWRLGEFTEIGISGENLATRRHIEFFDVSGLFRQTEVARSITLKITRRF